MRRDPIPDRPYLADLDKIIAVKRGDNRRRLERLKPFLPNAYWSYVSARHALETLPIRKWRPEAKAALQHCYSNTTTRDRIMEDLQTAVKPDPFLCPYCLMRQPESWDHYLPQDLAPEYSVLALNLVLVCDPCNRRKSNRFVEAPRSIIHPYFDLLPDLPILYAQATLTDRGIGLSFSIDATGVAAPQHLQTLAERHVEALRLFPAYEREGSSFAAVIISTIAASNPEPISQQTLDEALEARMRGLSNFPINCWEGAVIAALEELDGLLAYVNQRIVTLPAPPRLRPRRDKTAVRAAAAANALANP